MDHKVELHAHDTNMFFFSPYKLKLTILYVIFKMPDIHVFI